MSTGDLFRTARPGVNTGTDRAVIVFSDLELGAGGHSDDLPSTRFLEDIFADLDHRYRGVRHVDLVFNGDTFDFLKTQDRGQWPLRVTAAVAQRKLERILCAHASFFTALRCAIERLGSRLRLFFVTGNHDLELWFPQVQERIRQELGGSPRVFFPGTNVYLSSLWIEHGHQYDSGFAVHPRAPLLAHRGELVLNQPWAARSILEVMLPELHDLACLERARPRSLVMELLPVLREFLRLRFWRYCTEILGPQWWNNDDPLYAVQARSLVSIGWRWLRSDAGVHSQGPCWTEPSARKRAQVVLQGHLHRAARTEHKSRSFLWTGAMRDEVWIDETGRFTGRCPKVYAELHLAGERLLHCDLVRVNGDPMHQRSPYTTVQSVEGEISARLERLRSEGEWEVPPGRVGT